MAAENTIATAYVQLVASAEGMQDNISKELGAAGESSGGSFGKTFLTGAASVIAAGAAAVTSAAATIWNTATSTALAGDTIAKESVKIGVAADEYQTLAFAAEHSGFSIETFTTAARTLANSGYEGSIYEALEAVMALDDETERTAMATDLFGARSAMAMANLLDGTITLEDYKTQLADLGGIMSDEAVADSAAFQDSLTNVQTAIDGTVKSLSAEMLPGITQIMDGVAGIFAGSDGADAQVSAGIEALIGSFNSLIPKLVSLISTLAPQLLKAASELVMNLAGGLLSALPEMMPVLIEVVLGIADMLVSLIPTIAEVGMSIITAIVNGVAAAAPTLLPAMVEAIVGFITAIFDNADALLDAAVALIDGLCQGIIAALPVLIDALPAIIGGIVGFIENSTTAIIKAATILLMAIAEAIPAVITELVKVMPDIITAIIMAIQDAGPEMGVACLELLSAFLVAIPQIIADLWAAMPEVIDAIIESCKENFPLLVQNGMDASMEFLKGITDSSVFTKIGEKVTEIVNKFKENFHNAFDDFKTIGKNIIQGIIDGIKNMAGSISDTVGDVASNIANGFKSFFGIASPSKLFYAYGEFIDEGLANGINAGQGDVLGAMGALNGTITSDFSNSTIAPIQHGAISGEATNASNVMELLATYLPIIADGKNVNVSLEGDARGIFNLVREENRNYIKSNGASAFMY